MNRITVKTSVKADIDKVWNYWTKSYNERRASPRYPDKYREGPTNH